jgi:hypothetical protein
MKKVIFILFLTYQYTHALVADKDYSLMRDEYAKSVFIACKYNNIVIVDCECLANTLISSLTDEEIKDINSCTSTFSLHKNQKILEKCLVEKQIKEKIDKKNKYALFKCNKIKKND